ncbi:hypothetical protein [Streptomyces californicus]|uniref:hypothetical protein n=1 Tax=Streptomyces californicus TaxID=67351 RepID=UPI0036959E25
MNKQQTSDRYTLAVIAAVAILAASLAVAWLPTTISPGPLLAWATTYTGIVLGLAKAVHLPPARTLFAITLITAEALRITLTGLRHALDHAILGLAHLHTVGTTKLAHTTPKAA